MPPSPNAVTSRSPLLDWPVQLASDHDRKRIGTKFLKFGAPLLSIAVLAILAANLRGFDFAHLVAIIPRSPLFWLVFAAWYLTAPVADWVIFRRLWSIPPAGLLPLIGKGVGNDLLVGYAGELYFYEWARRRVMLAGSPFGAVKDVAILSAVAGNAATIAMVAAVWPFMSLLPLGGHGHQLGVSIAVVLGSSLLITLFRGRLFSLPRPKLLFVFALQLARIAVSTLLAGLLWHLALPQVELSLWLVLATLRLLVSRLPLLPNKDVVFAGLAVMLVGRDLDVAALITMIAGIILVTHVVVGTGLLAWHFTQERAG